MNTLRKYLKGLALSVLLISSAVYFLHAVIIQKVVVPLSCGKKVVLYGDHHRWENKEVIDELQIESIARYFADLVKDKKAELFVEEPLRVICDNYLIPTDTRQLARYCSNNTNFIQDIDFRKKFLKDACLHLFSEKGQAECLEIAQNIKNEGSNLTVGSLVEEMVDIATKKEVEEIDGKLYFTEEGLFTLFNAKILSSIYASEADVVGVIVGASHLQATLDAIAKHDINAWLKRSKVGSGASVSTSGDVQYALQGPELSFDTCDSQDNTASYCVIL